MAQDYDLIFAGGGLSSSLAAYRVAQAHPGLRLAIAEQGEALGGNHTWCFHETDVTAAQLAWLDPLITQRWEGQRVAFPERTRTLTTPYLAVTDDRLAEVVSAVPTIDVLTDAPVAQADPDGVTLADQRRLSGPVLDGRGPEPSPHLSLGYQKFLGQEVRTAAPHGVTTPMIMDATVPQTDGYRFVYVLPMAEDVLHIEDTYYADGEDLPKEALREEIAAYAARQGWQVTEIVREEDGILPIVLEGDIDAFLADQAAGPAPLGLRAGLFNQITGYSLPAAAALADRLAAACQGGVPSPQALSALVKDEVRTLWQRQSFYRALNRMLFRAAKPHLRYIVLQRHYGLPQPLIERFYAGRSTIADKARILAGKPPVGIGAALKALPPRRLERTRP